MRDTDLTDRGALVTGAAGGIGRAVAVALAAGGARAVALVDRPGTDTSAVVAEVEQHGAEAVALAADLSESEQVVGVARDAIAAVGPVEVLVNAAGVHERTMANRTSTDEMELEVWERVMAVNLTAPWLLTRELVGTLSSQERGSVVNVASQLGLVGAQASPAYTTSKAGLIQLTRSMAADLAPRGVRCNAVAPGAIETAMTDQIFASMPDPAGARAAALQTYMIKRFGDVDDVAAAVCFLASDASAWTTGSCLVVDGGQTAWR